MKDLIIFKNVEHISFIKNETFVSLEIYFLGDDFIKHQKRIDGLDLKAQKFFTTTYEEAFIKIKNALTNKEDFVEVEL